MSTQILDNPSQLMNVTTEIVEITPEFAHSCLAHNVHNRPVSARKVDEYAGAIQRGEWSLNGDAIRFAHDATLLDGQHRLMAVIKANRPITSLVIRGLDTTSQETMDTGKKRSIAEMLALRGEVSTARLAGTANLLYNYAKTGILYSGALKISPTPQQILNFIDDNYDELDAAIHMPNKDRASRLLTPSVASALYFLFAKVDRDDANTFFKALSSGDSLANNDPIRVLRERLLRELGKAQGRISPTVRAALAIKAFNYWRAGHTVGTLKWTGGGSAAESFPRVVDCDFVPEVDKRR